MPCPPPGAGATLATVSVVAARVAVVAVAAAGIAEVFGLKKSASVFFAGEGVGLTVAAVAFALRPRFAAGEPEGSAAAVGDAFFWAFSCVRCFVGDPAGDSMG